MGARGRKRGKHPALREHLKQEIEDRREEAFSFSDLSSSVIKKELPLNIVSCLHWNFDTSQTRKKKPTVFMLRLLAKDDFNTNTSSNHKHSSPNLSSVSLAFSTTVGSCVDMGGEGGGG